MKKFIFLILSIFLCNCKEEKECCVFAREVEITLRFNHTWNETPISNADFNQLKFTNQNGETLSIARLRYVISNITLTDTNNNTRSFSDYNLVDVTNNKNLSFTLSKSIKTSNYKNIAFTFGFKDEDNVDGIYQDLNVANFNVPEKAGLGGGYHYMQFDGKYLNSNQQKSPFNYHAIRAANKTQKNPWENLPDTSFTIDLGNITVEKNTTININVNLAEWFTNPNTWNLNELNTVLMPNFEAQIRMNANGKSVFSLVDLIE